MAAITIRGLAEDDRRALKERAARHNRSMEAEARAIISAAVRVDVQFVDEWLDLAAEVGGVELETPGRSTPREVDFR